MIGVLGTREVGAGDLGSPEERRELPLSAG